MAAWLQVTSLRVVPVSSVHLDDIEVMTGRIEVLDKIFFKFWKNVAPVLVIIAATLPVAWQINSC